MKVSDPAGAPRRYENRSRRLRRLNQACICLTSWREDTRSDEVAISLQPSVGLACRPHRHVGGPADPWVIGPTYLWTATRDGADVHRVSMLISRDVRAVEAESRARWT